MRQSGGLSLDSGSTGTTPNDFSKGKIGTESVRGRPKGRRSPKRDIPGLTESTPYDFSKGKIGIESVRGRPKGRRSPEGDTPGLTAVPP